METKTLVVVALVAVLLIISTMQAFQLMELKNKVAELKDVSSTAPQASKPNIKQSLNNLPSMVGGC